MTKLKSASRYGPRYGAPLKKIVAEIEGVQKKAQVCPRCGRKSLKRRGYARWECTKCRATVAGGAYAPKTEMGAIAERIIRKGERYEIVMNELEEKKKKEQEKSEKESREKEKVKEEEKQ